MSTALMPQPTATPGGPMALLAHGVPLSLLLDLFWGPRSEELLRHERPLVPPVGPPAAPRCAQQRVLA